MIEIFLYVCYLCINSYEKYEEKNSGLRYMYMYSML